MTIPLAWLRDPGRVYPVVIDPTVTIPATYSVDTLGSVKNDTDAVDRISRNCTGCVCAGKVVAAVSFDPSVLPGSDALQLAMYIGYAVGGIPGGLVALLASILPPTVIILGVTAILHRLRRESWISSFIEGLTPAISVLMVFTAWKIFQKGGTMGWEAWAIGLISLAGMASKRVPERILIVIAGLVGVLFLS